MLTRNVFLNRFINNLSADELNQFSTTDHPEDFQFIQEFQENNEFWALVCQIHYKLTPYHEHCAKTYFHSEYLFSKGRFVEAAEKGGFRSLNYFVNHFLRTQTLNLNSAELYAQRAAIKFGIVGHMLLLQVYEAAVKAGDNSSSYAQKGLEQIQEIQKKSNDPVSIHYLETLGWTRAIRQNYGNLTAFCEKGIAKFEVHEDQRSPQLTS